eukprot:3520116-Prorocentrum_lima.AAC.1
MSRWRRLTHNSGVGCEAPPAAARSKWRDFRTRGEALTSVGIPRKRARQACQGAWHLDAVGNGNKEPM